MQRQQYSGRFDFHTNEVRAMYRNLRNLLAATTIAAGAFCLFLPSTSALADHPKPSLYPISWELTFTHSAPKRIIVEGPKSSVPEAYWYMTYTVVNNSDKEQLFLPIFEMLARDGKVIRSDVNIPAKVFDAIKTRERANGKFLVPATQVGGEIRIGEDQGKESVAIWREPDPRMGTFSLFAGGLSGESVGLKDDDGKPVKGSDGQQVILRKTLQLNYQIRGDEVYPGEDAVVSKGEEWVMR